ncbi:hypothetical protein [Prochlorococcus marinus]|uniref:hypothetical protein n=1 Tax=Prochlorococcus marinus TaxID=1219 RepID=UPI000A6239CB|nr:hypothetical protein [Prochlorococcus marinus]
MTLFVGHFLPVTQQGICASCSHLEISKEITTHGPSKPAMRLAGLLEAVHSRRS